GRAQSACRPRAAQRRAGRPGAAAWQDVRPLRRREPGAAAGGGTAAGRLGFLRRAALAALRRPGGLRAQPGADAAARPARGRAGFLAGVQRDRVDEWVTVGRRHKRWRCRLLAVGVPPAVEQQRRQRVEREARALGREVSAERRALCAWTVLLTNAPRELLSLAEALALRRRRWQIELLFRLWKDEGKID